MAEAAGLVLGVIGVAASFKACIELFDFIVQVKESNEEYEQLSALLGLQRLRFEIWGESVGLPSGRFNHEPTIPYNTQLDRPEVQPDIERALETIRNLLVSVTSIDSRYGPTASPASEEKNTILRGTKIFQKSYDRLKNRIRKEHKSNSALKTTRWVLHDAAQFKESISRLTAFVDGLVQVTTTLGLLEERYEALRLHEEINTITNEEDLELLVDATSRLSASSFNKSISETASRRLMTVSGSIRSRCSDGSTYSFHSARTRPKRVSRMRDLVPKHTDMALDALIESDNEGSDYGEPTHPTKRSCAECEDAGVECSTVENIISCVHCIRQLKQCSFDLARLSISMLLESLPHAGHEELLLVGAATANSAAVEEKDPDEAGNSDILNQGLLIKSSSWRSLSVFKVFGLG